MQRFRPLHALSGALALCGLGVTYPAFTQDIDPAALLERLERMEARQQAMEALLEQREQRIADLERQLGLSQRKSVPVEILPTEQTAGEAATGETSATAVSLASGRDKNDPFGEFTPGRGFTVARTEYGELQLSLYTYFRYLNQEALDDEYTDHFGNTRQIDIRNDFQVNKVFLYTKGWLLNPRLNYIFYVWSTNTALGSTSNNLVAGSVSYRFDEAFNLAFGVVGVPTSRTMMGQFPYWHRVDNRLIADEFMRGSFTQGLAATGKLAEGLHYNVTLGNNLSNFGVDAGELDSNPNTLGGALVWMPTTGEFGPRASIGDFEHHDQLATLFGVHATYSQEDRQSQPGQDSPENTQIRLSDGITVFTPDVFAPGVTVQEVDYQMFAFNAGMKYRGFALEGELFYRVLDNFKTDIAFDVEQQEDHGVQAHASYMLSPKQLQLYTNASKIFGEYGNPWDAGIGLNWWPFRQRGFRLNGEAIYLEDSPVGYNSVPYPLGGNGWVFVSNAELSF